MKLFFFPSFVLFASGLLTPETSWALPKKPSKKLIISSQKKKKNEMVIQQPVTSRNSIPSEDRQTSSGQSMVIDINAQRARSVPLVIKSTASCLAASDIAQQLSRAGIVQLLPDDDQNPMACFYNPDFTSWQIYNDGLLAIVRVENSCKAWLRIFSVAQKTMVAEKCIEAANSKETLEKISNAIYEYITGDQGYFHRKIFYSRAIGLGLQNKKTEIAQCDISGENDQILGYPKNLAIEKIRALRPKLSPDKAKIVYLGFHPKKGLSIRIRHRESGKDYPISIENMSPSSVDFFDNDTLICSLGNAKASNIWLYRLSTGQKRPLTYSSKGINVSPIVTSIEKFSPQGSNSIESREKKILFISNRLGSPKIFMMNPDGTQQVQVSRGPGSYYTPNVSPNGRLVAFIKSYGGQFYLGVCALDGRHEKALIKGHMMDSPQWLNNNVLCLSYQSYYGKKFSLLITNISGRYFYKLDMPHSADHPWAL